MPSPSWNGNAFCARPICRRYRKVSRSEDTTIILVNPFPIFPRHLTVPELAHTPQRIATRFTDMLELAEALTDYTIFYNGPKCGASAPDQLQFQDKEQVHAY